MIKSRFSVILMVICAFLWSTGGILIKATTWNSFAITGSRSFIASFLVLGFLVVSHKKLTFSKTSCLASVLLSVAYFSFIGANKLTTAANAIVLQYTSTIFIMIYGVIFLKQKWRKKDVAAAVFTFLGIALFFIDGIGAGTTVGNLIAIFAGAVLGGMYFISGTVSLEERLSSIWLAHIITAVVGVPFVWITNAEFSIHNIIFILLLGIVQIGLPYILFALAVEKCPPFACSLIGVLEPLLNPVWVFLDNEEKPGITALFGALIVLSTVTMWCILGDTKKKKDAA